MQERRIIRQRAAKRQNPEDVESTASTSSSRSSTARSTRSNTSTSSSTSSVSGESPASTSSVPGVAPISANTPIAATAISTNLSPTLPTILPGQTSIDAETAISIIGGETLPGAVIPDGMIAANTSSVEGPGGGFTIMIVVSSAPEATPSQNSSTELPPTLISSFSDVSPDSSQASSRKPGLSNGEVAGITIGSMAGLLLLLGLLFFCWRRRKNRKMERQYEDMMAPSSRPAGYVFDENGSSSRQNSDDIAPVMREY